MSLQPPAPSPVDARLTDDDVIALLQTAYPRTDLEYIQGNDKIMGQYFTCVDHGRDVIRSHITGEPLSDNQEMASAEEEEEDDTTDDDSEEDSDEDDASDGGSDDSVQVRRRETRRLTVTSTVRASTMLLFSKSVPQTP